MAGAALFGRQLMWRVGTVVALHDETATARTITLGVPEWPGHIAGQHVDVRLTAPDGYSAVRSYSIASAPNDCLRAKSHPISRKKSQSGIAWSCEVRSAAGSCGAFNKLSRSN
jgi:ferredoxin-NADP reductase